MTPSTLEALREPLARIINEFANKRLGAHYIGKDESFAIVDALIPSIRTALQDERGRAREAALEEAAQAALDNLCEGDSDLIAAHNECADEIANAIRTLKAQSPPGEAQGWRIPAGYALVPEYDPARGLRHPAPSETIYGMVETYDREIEKRGHLETMIAVYNFAVKSAKVPAPPLPTETEE